MSICFWKKYYICSRILKICCSYVFEIKEFMKELSCQKNFNKIIFFAENILIQERISCFYNGKMYIERKFVI